MMSHARVRLGLSQLLGARAVKRLSPVVLLMPSPKGDHIKPRISLFEDGDCDAAELRSQSKVRETGQLRSILKVSAVVKQDNFTARRSSGSKSFA
jgi:hypothetical protein